MKVVYLGKEDNGHSFPLNYVSITKLMVNNIDYFCSKMK